MENKTEQELINGNYYWVRKDKISQYMPAQYINGTFFLCGDDPGFPASRWEDIVSLPRHDDHSLSELAEAKREVEKLQAKIKVLLTDNAMLESTVTQFEEQIAELKGKNRIQEAAVELLAEKIIAKDKEKIDLNEAGTEVGYALEEAELKLIEATKTIRAQKNGLDALRAELARLKAWIPVSERLPEFGLHVLVYCRIYGYYIGSYEQIGGNFGNWHDGKNLGVLPPTHWRYLPEPPGANPPQVFTEYTELSSLKQTIIESELYKFFPKKEISFHDKVALAIGSFIADSFTSEQVKDMLKNCADTITKQFISLGAPRTPADFEAIEYLKQTTIKKLLPHS